MTESSLLSNRQDCALCEIVHLRMLRNFEARLGQIAYIAPKVVRCLARLSIFAALPILRADERQKVWNSNLRKLFLNSFFLKRNRHYFSGSTNTEVGSFSYVKLCKLLSVNTSRVLWQGVEANSRLDNFTCPVIDIAHIQDCVLCTNDTQHPGMTNVTGLWISSLNTGKLKKLSAGRCETTRKRWKGNRVHQNSR